MVAAAQPPHVVEANQRVQQGERLFEDGDFDAALAEFERAYEVIGDHPNRYLVLYNIGQAHERRFRYDLAMGYYRRYLEEGGENAEDRAEVEEAIQRLQGLLATVRVEVNVPRAEIWLEDRQIGIAPGEVLVPGGRHTLEVRASGYGPERRDLQLAPRTETDVSFTLSPYGGRGIDPLYFTLATAGAVGVALIGGALGITALVRSDDAKARLLDDELQWTVTESERQEIYSLGIAADVLYSTAGALAVTAVVLAILTDFGGARTPPPESATLRVAPMLGANVGGVAAEVRW